MMKVIFISGLIVGLLGCRSVEATPLESFNAAHSTEIQNETKELVLKSHNAFHTGCKANPDALHLIEYRTILAKNDSEDYVSTSVVRWEVNACGTPFLYETRIQRIRRHPRDPFEKNYGITIEPIYELRKANGAR